MISAMYQALCVCPMGLGFPPGAGVRGSALGLHPGLLDDVFCHWQGPLSPGFTYFSVFQVSWQFLAL